MAKRLSFRSKPDSVSVPELPIITTWIRFLLGALYGVSLGLRNETRGLSGVLFGLNLITFMPMFWFNSYLDANIESYKSLNFVGVPNAFALMLLVWIAMFTKGHEESESSLQTNLVNMGTVVGGGPAVLTSETGIVEDEF